MTRTRSLLVVVLVAAFGGAALVDLPTAQAKPASFAEAKKKKPAPKPKPRKAVTYTASGPMTSFDGDSLTLSVDELNKAMDKLLGRNDDEVTVVVGPKTKVTIDGESGDLADVCEGDEVKVSVLTRRPARDVLDVAAASVTVTTDEGASCGLDEDELDDEDLDDEDLDDEDNISDDGDDL